MGRWRRKRLKRLRSLLGGVLRLMERAGDDVALKYLEELE